LLLIVTPGQSSVRNGVVGNPTPLYRLQTGLSAQAQRTATGSETFSDQTSILSGPATLAWA